MASFEEILIVAAILLLLGVVASKTSSKLGIPALLLFLLIGMLAGSEGLGRIPFDNASLAQSVGVVALSFILFAGGLDTDRSLHLEKRVAEKLAARIAVVRAAEVPEDPKLSAEQNAAVKMAVGGAVTVVTGGPCTCNTLVAAAPGNLPLVMNLFRVASAAFTVKPPFACAGIAS